MNQPKCTKARHKWTFIKNVTLKSLTPRTMTIETKGSYCCEHCGEKKLGRVGNEMKALSIRQPWAWLIANGYKDVENREWHRRPGYRGELYIHASKGCTKTEYKEAVEFAKSINPTIKIPPLEELERGGLVAKAILIGVVNRSLSPWFVGPLGLALDKVQKIEFIPCNGQLGFLIHNYLHKKTKPSDQEGFATVHRLVSVLKYAKNYTEGGS